MLTADDLRTLKHDLAVETGELDEDCWLPNDRWFEGIAALIAHAEATLGPKEGGRGD
jgi:hypothetical protein